MNKILYVEDDLNLAYITRYNIAQRGFEVTHCDNGSTAFETFKCNRFDLCILDVMLPGMDGFELAEKIRQHDKEIPILFLTVKSMTDDKLHGLRIGGDDYFTKPYNVDELLLKIGIFLKRRAITTAECNEITIGKSTFDVNGLSLKNSKSEHRLTFKEAELLRYFYSHRNNVLKREDILSAVWGNDDYFLGRSMDVFISRLRKYFAEDKSVKIENIHGVGFRMSVSGTN
jgi:two-component system, OmpR family, response regulator VicR